jgi:hypothetical protein
VGGGGAPAGPLSCAIVVGRARAKENPFATAASPLRIAAAGWAACARACKSESRCSRSDGLSAASAEKAGAINQPSAIASRTSPEN